MGEEFELSPITERWKHLMDVKEWTPEEILNKISEYFNIPVSMIFGKSKRKEIAYPRHCVCYFVRIKTTLSFADIGKFMNSRDHTTILFSCKHISNLLDTDETSRRQIVALSNIFSCEVKINTKIITRPEAFYSNKRPYDNL